MYSSVTIIIVLRVCRYRLDTLAVHAGHVSLWTSRDDVYTERAVRGFQGIFPEEDSND